VVKGVSSVGGSNVILKEELENNIAAVLFTNRSAAIAYGLNPEYEKGFIAALMAVATAFNLRVDLQRENQPTYVSGY
jgi:hypothetical protein